MSKLKEISNNINKKEVIDFIKNPKFQISLTVILFLIILISSTQIRLSNIPILKDQTTGEYTTNDLDSLYFYRIAETKLNQGSLPQVDVLRAPGYNTSWLIEILPDVMILLYKIEKIFSPSISFNYSATISGPIIYGFILVAFFILCLLLTKSKFASLLASAFLAFVPVFLFRSTAGFYDHDHLGVLAVILLLIVFLFSLKKFEESIKNSIIFGLLSGFFTALVLVSWGGAITFVLVIIPIACLFYYLLNNESKERFMLFYALWFFSGAMFPYIFGQGFTFQRYMDSYGIAASFVLAFIIIDYLLSKNLKKFSFLKEKYEKAYSLAVTIILGIGGLIVIGKNPIMLIEKMWATLVYPFFRDFDGRLGSTVAENAQPFLVDLISQNGKILFWFFMIGLVFVSYGFSKRVDSLKNKIYLTSSTFILFFAVLFSRYSSSSLFNGENFISQLFYIAGVLAFLICFIYVYSKEKFKVEVEYLLLFALALTVVINARAAVRSFFLIAPFICLIASLTILELIKIARKTKDDTLKYISWTLLIIALLLSFNFLFGNPITHTSGTYQTISAQAKYIGPSADAQWQNAMAWARNDTNEEDIFVHWWDYGYFIQTLANRPTVTDGGHAGGSNTDHYIGRYILTTPNPKTAYSFMKTWNVSYLLIDPTELGKYSAFSQIGSDNSWDRISTGISAGVADEKQTQENVNGTTKVYNLGVCVDGDIEYKNNQTRIFLPGMSVNAQQKMSCNSYLAGIIMEIEIKGNLSSFKQPIGVFIYNNKQYRMPLKNVYFNGQMLTFSEGIDAVVYLIPRIDETAGKIDNLGAVIYLSPRTFNSLMGKLYVLNDYYGEYPGLDIADKEDDPAVNYFKQFTNGQLNEFIYYQGLRAPLKIWKVNYPTDTPVHKEFLDPAFTFGGLDYLFQ